jgi:hypothetical protein
MLKKLFESIKCWFGFYPPELKEMHRKAKEANGIYRQARYKVDKTPIKSKTAVKKPVSTVWPKDFEAEDVAKALDKQAPKPKENKVATKPGLYANIHKKQARIEKQKAEGKPVETMRKVGSKGAPTAKAFKESAKTAKK